jgi:hypothetical protein
VVELRERGHPGLVLFSSGSTGKNKASLHDLVPFLEKFEVPRHAMRTIAFLLFDHIGGINTLLYTLSNGGVVISIRDRDPEIVCVVEEARDVVAIERTREFAGVYHVLGGALSPIDGVGPDQLRIKELLARAATGTLREVILATNPNAGGEATASFLARALAESGVRVTRLASGLPVGGDLDYADEVTLSRAFAGRREA